MDRQVDVAIIGSGTAGLNALGVVRRYSNNFVLINGGETGTTCARAGCMPSKVMIQVAEDFHRRHIFGRSGIVNGEGLSIETAESMEHVRDLRDVFVDRVLGSSTDNLNDKEFIQGYAHFVEPDVLEVNGKHIKAKAIVIATGTTPFLPAAWNVFRDRILTTDEIFEQESLPESMAVIGLGVIGLELGQALHRMGVAITGIDQLNTVGGLGDPDIAKMAINLFGKEFPLWLGEAAQLSEHEGKLRITVGGRSVVADKVLASLGRTPNVERLNLGILGIPCNSAGIPEYNPHTMQVGNLPVFIAGDVSGERLILHEAGHEGKIAGFNAVSGKITAFKRKTPLGITFCDPNIVTVGMSWEELQKTDFVSGEINFGPVGRALIMGKNRGLLKVYATKSDGKLLGASMIAPAGEHLAHLLAWAMEQELGVVDLLRKPFYHPVLEEALQAALYDVYAKIDKKPDYPVELEALDQTG